ncbi:YbgC/FadM family acyl-CoA thioesterase [Pelotalea chapellei]|uniref:YbgC/FadM family acyl-CoA thioesterase n=1 Tax=Pelotalea chapellei TaxID=44671 RepID=A0ABS5U4Z1_9BACT|nr:YbgC/FadM family acyl-CoA thioesterase [Pelotalea chapellei]MBT1070720.1 YbgC/FadM family acyl-CoA thioesterase [Pelotalea chapellei]
MQVRVYYEDTDAAGIVYHANYLKFFERARTEFLRDNGFSVSEMAAEGHVFPVIRMEIDLTAPARHDDLLTILTVPVRVGGSSFTLRQQVKHSGNGRILVEALVTLACVSPTLKAKRIPGEVRNILENFLESTA